MALREYIVLDPNGNDTDIIVEHIVRGTPPEVITSEAGDKARLKKVSLIARTNTSWADAAETRFGVNGFKNRALGMTFRSEKEADRYAEAKGLVRADDFDRHFIDDKMDQFGQAEEAQQRQIDAYHAQHKAHFDNMNWS